MYHAATYECDKCGFKSNNEDHVKRYRTSKGDVYHLCKKCDKEFDKLLLTFIGIK